MKKNKPLVSLVVVNYNGRRFLDGLFSSVRRLDYPKGCLEIITVDNGSSDGSVGFIRKKYPEVDVIKSGDNNYCRANNLGIAKAKGEFVATLNTDIVLDEGWLKPLIKVMQKEKKAAAVASKVLDREGRIQNAGLVAMPNFYWDELGSGKDNDSIDSLREIDSVCGACVLYRKESLINIGMFDEDFLMYGEDTDISWRLRNAGHKLMLVPESTAVHFKHGSSNADTANYYIERNRLIFIAKHYPQKLSNSLMGSGYLFSSADTEKSRKIYAVLPFVLEKLFKHHPSSLCRNVLSEVFREVDSIIYKESIVLQDKVNRYSGELEDLRSMYSVSEKRASELEVKLSKVDVKETLRSQEVDELKDNVRRAALDFTRAREEIVNKDNIIRQLEKSLFELEKELTRKDKELQRKIEEAADREEKSAETDMELIRIKSELDAKKELFRQSSERLSELQRQNDEKERIVSDYSAKISQLSLSLEIKEKRLSESGDLSREISRVSAELSSARQELENKISEFEAVEAELVSLRQENKTASELYKEAQEKLKQNEDELERLRARESDLTSGFFKERAESAAEAKLISDRLKASEEELSSKAAELELMIREKEALCKELSVLQSELSAQVKLMEDKNGALMEKDIVLKARENDLASLASELKDLSSKMEDMIANENRLADECRRAQSVLEEKEKENHKLRLEIESYSSAAKLSEEDVSNKARELEANNVELDRLRSEVASRDIRIDELNKMISETCSQLELRAEELNKKDYLVGQKENVISELQEEVSKLSGLFKESSDEVLRREGLLLKKESQLSELSVERERQEKLLKDDIRRLRDEQSSLDSVLKIKIEELEKSLVERKELDDEVGRLRSDTDGLKDYLGSKGKGLSDALEYLKSRDEEVSSLNIRIEELSGRLKASLDDLSLKDERLRKNIEDTECLFAQSNAERESLRAQVSEHVLELESRMKDLSSRDSEILQKNNEIEELSVRLRDCLLQIQEYERQLISSHESLLDAQARLLEEEKKHEESNSRAAELSLRLKESLVELEKKDEHLLRNEDVFRDLVAEKDSEIRRLLDTESEYKATIESYLNDLGRQSDEIKEKIIELEEMRDTISEYKFKLQSALDESARKDAAIAERDSEIGHSRKRISELLESLDCQSADIRRKDELINEKEAVIFQLHRDSDDMKEAIAEGKKKEESMKEELLRQEQAILAAESKLSELTGSADSLKKRSEKEIALLKEELEVSGRVFQGAVGKLEDELSRSLKDAESKDSEIKAYRRELDNLTVQLACRMNELLSKEGELLERAHFIDVKESELVQKDSEIDKREEEIVLLKLEIDRKDREIKGIESGIERLSSELEGRITEIRDKNRRIDDIGAEMRVLSAELQSRYEEAVRQSAVIADKENNIIVLNGEIAALKEEKDSLCLRLKAGEDDLRRTERSLKEKEERIIVLESELADCKKEISFLSGILAQRMDEVLRLTGDLDVKDRDIRCRDEHICSLKTENDGLSIQLKERLDEILRKDGEISAKEDDIRKANDALDRFMGTKGVRFILRPLWKMADFSKKITGFPKSNMLWAVIAFLSAPFYYLLGLYFLLEDRLWKIIAGRPGFLSFKKPRKLSDNTSVSMVIPNYNGKELIRLCLESVLASKGFRDGVISEIIVVDDGSREGDPEFIKANFPQVRLIRNKRNRGFGYTCNRGIKAASGGIVVLINNDIIVTEDFLSPLIKHFSDSNVFAVTPKMYAWDKSTFVWGMHIGHFENGYIRLWNEAETGNPVCVDTVSPSLFAIGGAMVFRKNDWLWLGGFDRIYRPNCWEDIDISYRAWKRGMTVVYEPSSVLYHKGRATLTYERHKEIKNELSFIWKNITDPKIIFEHIRLLPVNLYKYRLPFLRGTFWAAKYLPLTLAHRLKDRFYAESTDKKIFDGCMLFYRNFMRSGFKVRQEGERRCLLLITPFMPYPLNVGGKIRMHTLARICSEKYDIMLLTLIDNKDEERFVPELKQVFKEVFTVYPKTPVSNLLYPRRYQFSYSRELIEKLKDIQRSYPVDIVHMESNELLYLAKYVKFAPIVYTEHDASILSFGKSLYQKKDGSVIDNYYDYLKKVRYHCLAYGFLDRVVVLSGEDERKLRAFFPDSRFVLVPTGVDPHHFSFRPRAAGARDIVFVGHYPHFPNEDTVVYLTEKILPLIRKKDPRVRLIIVGSCPTERVRQLAWRSGIEFVGDTDDVRQHIERAAVFVNFVRVGAGIKTKLLETMALGRPIVANRLGIYGIEAKNEESVLLAENPEDFASAVLRLMDDDELYGKIALNARKLVESGYDCNIVADKLCSVYKDIIDENDLLREHRGVMQNGKLLSSGAPLPAAKPVEIKNDPGSGSSRAPDHEDDTFVDLFHKVRVFVEEAVKETYSAPSLESGPEELHLELTHNCNSKCVMCDLWDYRRRFPDCGNDISSDEIKNLARSSRYLKNIKTVLFSGGEPFLREDIVDLINFFNSHYPSISIGALTNAKDPGLVLGKVRKIMDTVRPANFWIGSSLDGIGQRHDEVRGVSGAFEGMIGTFGALKNEFPQIDLSLTMTLTPYNADQLLSCRDFAMKRGINFFAQFFVQKEARDKLVWDREKLCLIGTQVRSIIEGIIGDKSCSGIMESLRQGTYDVDLITQIYYWAHLVEYQVNPQRFFSECFAGHKFAMLNPYGDMFFCPLLKDRFVGNIRGKSAFDDLWLSEKANNIRSFINCKSCHCWLVCIIFPLVSNALATFRHKIKNSVLGSVPARPRVVTLTPPARPKYQELSRNENILLNDSEFEERKIILDSAPRGIGIGAHYNCNAQCSFCLSGTHKNFSLQIYKDLFEKKLENVISKAEYLNLCGFGELLLMPEAEKFLFTLNDKFSDVNKIITTNGSPLVPKLASRVLETKYTLQISIHASNARLHKALTNMDNFEKIVSQIREITSLRRNSAQPHVILVSVLNTLNLEDLPSQVRLSKDLGADGLVCHYLTAYNSAHLKMSCFFKQDVTNRVFEEAMDISRKINMPLTLPPSFGKNDPGAAEGKNFSVCSEPWKYVYIETESSVLPCCFAGNHIGYLDRDSFENIWNSPAYQHLRKSLISKNMDNLWCKNCHKCNPLNVNDIRSHISLRPEVQSKLLKEFKL